MSNWHLGEPGLSSCPYHLSVAASGARTGSQSPINGISLGLKAGMLWSSTKSKPVDLERIHGVLSVLPLLELDFSEKVLWTICWFTRSSSWLKKIRRHSSGYLISLSIAFAWAIAYSTCTKLLKPSLQFPAKLDWPVRAFHALHRHRKKHKPHTGFRLFKRSCPYLVHQPSPVNQSIQLGSRRKLFVNKSGFACRFLSV